MSRYSFFVDGWVIYVYDLFCRDFGASIVRSCFPRAPLFLPMDMSRSQANWITNKPRRQAQGETCLTYMAYFTWLLIGTRPRGGRNDLFARAHCWRKSKSKSMSKISILGQAPHFHLFQQATLPAKRYVHLLQWFVKLILGKVL